MISRNKDNFIVRHYDWIVAGVAALALAGAALYYVSSLGNDAESSATDAVAAIDRKKPSKCGVEKTDLAPFDTVLRQAKVPSQLAEATDGRENSFISERRVRCKCKKIPPVGAVQCPFCEQSLVVVNEVDEAAKKAERWKARYGVDPDGNDKDGDGFTNQEEFAAATDPTDAKDHPEYLDSLQLTLPLKETHVPFALVGYTKLNNGWRCEFNNTKRTARMSATIGEEIVLPVSRAVGKAEDKPTGFVLKGFKKLEEERGFIAGTKTPRMVDVSVAEVQRKSDGKVVLLEKQDNLTKIKLKPIDVQATLAYDRMGMKNFEVVTGDEIDLNGEKCEIVSVKPVGKGGEVVVKNKVSGKQKTLKALE